MKITLKNGQLIDLDWNSIIFEYLCDYEGGIDALLSDLQEKRNLMYIANHLVYSVMSANMEEQLDYRRILSLVKVEDIEKIIDFIIKNCDTEPNVNVTKRH